MKTGDGRRFEREVLVALQPVGNRGADWEATARQIETSPTTWRWWIRRHPASTPQQDMEYGRLLSLRGPNVVIAEAGALPLPALLRNTMAVVSLFSGAAVEAAMFGVPALFMGAEAAGRFPDLLAQGGAMMVDPGELNERIAQLPRHPTRKPVLQPSLDATLDSLQQMAAEYRVLR
jgi:hypothetical protein